MSDIQHNGSIFVLLLAQTVRQVD